MNINYKFLRRPAAALSALALVVGIAAPAFMSTGASAWAQVQTRSIRMSDSTPGASGVTYRVEFNVATTGNIRGINVDFCQESPLAEDTNCTLPNNMVLTGVGVSSVTGLNTGGGWTAQVNPSQSTAVEIYDSTAGSVSAAATVSFELTGITNPDTTGTFYARILTYADANGTNGQAELYTSGDVTNVVDFGGIALSTVTEINITAKVQEQLVFCVSSAAITDNCVTLSSPDVNLGALTGGNYILDTTNNFAGTVYTRLSTNALNGAVVRVKTTSTSTCAGLTADNAADDCDEFDAVGGTPTTLTGDSTSGFGMCVDNGANTTIESPYSTATNCGTATGAGAAGSATTGWILNDTVASSTYGDPLFNTGSTAVNLEDNEVNYGVSRTLTTPAGIYTTTQSMIATSTF